MIGSDVETKYRKKLASVAPWERVEAQQREQPFGLDLDARPERLEDDERVWRSRAKG